MVNCKKTTNTEVSERVILASQTNSERFGGVAAGETVTPTEQGGAVAYAGRCGSPSHRIALILA